MLNFLKIALGPTMKVMRPQVNQFMTTLADNTYLAVMNSETAVDDVVVAKMAAPAGKTFFDRLTNNFENGLPNAPAPEVETDAPVVEG